MDPRHGSLCFIEIELTVHYRRLARMAESVRPSHWLGLSSFEASAQRRHLSKSFYCWTKRHRTRTFR